MSRVGSRLDRLEKRRRPHTERTEEEMREDMEREAWMAEQPGGAEALDAFHGNVAEHGHGRAAVHAMLSTQEGRDAVNRLTLLAICHHNGEEPRPPLPEFRRPQVDPLEQLAALESLALGRAEYDAHTAAILGAPHPETDGRYRGTEHPDDAPTTPPVNELRRPGGWGG